MSKIAAVDPNRAAGKSAELLASVRKMLGAVPNLFTVTANAPSALESMAAQFAAAAHGQLKAGVREAIALAVAEANGCDYCLSAHTAFARQAGLRALDIRNARDGEASDPKLAAMLAFARTLVLERGRVSPGAVDSLRQAGVGDGEVLEVIANVALNVFTNYVNMVAETDIDFPIVRAGTA